MTKPKDIYDNSHLNIGTHSPGEPNNELDKILFRFRWQCIADFHQAKEDGDPKPKDKTWDEAKSAINSLTLKQVLELIGAAESTPLTVTPQSSIRDKFRAELRQSAERIWKI